MDTKSTHTQRTSARQAIKRACARKTYTQTLREYLLARQQPAPSSMALSRGEGLRLEGPHAWDAPPPGGLEPGSTRPGWAVAAASGSSPFGLKFGEKMAIVHLQYAGGHIDKTRTSPAPRRRRKAPRRSGPAALWFRLAAGTLLRSNAAQGGWVRPKCRRPTAPHAPASSPVV